MTTIDSAALQTFAELGLGLAGFSGVALVLMRGGAALNQLESDRLGIMLGSSLGAMFLSILPLVLSATDLDPNLQCRASSAVMAVYTAGFLRFYMLRTLRMRREAPEIVTGVPFGLVSAGHAVNLLLQGVSAAGVVACGPAYLAGLFWLLFHAAYQFGRILFIRPRVPARSTPATGPDTGGPRDPGHDLL